MPDSNIGTLVTFVVMGHALAIAIGILMERRQPAAKLAWFLALFFLPLVGILIYLLFGRLRPRLRIRRRVRANAAYLQGAGALHDASPLGLQELPQTIRGLIELTRRTTGAGISTGDHVRVILDGEAMVAALTDAIGQAHDYLHLEYYIFQADATGRKVCDALVDAARRGVAVRLVYDGAGSYGLHRKLLRPLVEAGGQVTPFLPIRLPVFTDRRDFRNHRKLVVADGTVGFAGGMNIGDEYLGESAGKPHWRDCHMQIRGPAALDLEWIFEEDWFHATGNEIAVPRPATLETAEGDGIVQVISSGPDRPWPTFQQAVFTVISSAQSRVWITTPYFVPDESILMALQTAAFRGVDVRLLVPRKSDLVLLTYTNRSYFLPLLEAGVRVFEYLPGMIHAKTITADGTFSLVGSANMDRRSFRLNFEVCVSIVSPHTTRTLEAVFEKDLERSREVMLEAWHDRPRIERFLESSVQLFSPLL